MYLTTCKKYLVNKICLCKHFFIVCRRINNATQAIVTRAVVQSLFSLWYIVIVIRLFASIVVGSGLSWLLKILLLVGRGGNRFRKRKTHFYKLSSKKFYIISISIYKPKTYLISSINIRLEFFQSNIFFFHISKTKSLIHS